MIIKLKPGDFVFFETCSVSGRVIRWFQRRLFGKRWSNVNHVAVCVSSPDEVREAVIPRVQIHPYTNVKDREIVAIVRPAFMQPNEALYKWLNKQHTITGHWYGILQIFGMAWCGLMVLLGHKPKRNPIRAGRNCTEDAYHFKKDAEREFNVVDDDGLQPDYIYPSQLLIAMEASPNYKVYRISHGILALAEEV